MTFTAALCWSMGSEVLYEPLQTHSLLLPFLCYLMLVWSVSCGDLAALPWIAGVGSLLLQTHLSYAVLVPVLALWALAGLALALRNARDTDPGSEPMLRRRATRTGLVTVAVLVACWTQPLVEQFTSDGTGNISGLLEGLGDESATFGYDHGTRLTARVVALPPWWLRPSFGDVADSSATRLPSGGVALVSLAAVAGVLAWCAWDARRRQDQVVFGAVMTGGVALIAGLATAGRAPAGFFGITANHFRWLWPLAAFVTFALTAAAVRRLASADARRDAGLVGGLAVVTAVVAALNFPASDQGTASPISQTPVVEDLGDQMADLEGRGTLLVRIPKQLGDSYGPAVLAELQRREVPFVIDNPGLVRQLGPGRRFTGGNADAELLVVTGDDVRRAPPGARRVSFHAALTTAEQAERAELERAIDGYIADGRVRLNERGRAALEGLGGGSDEPPSRAADPEVALQPRAVAGLAAQGFLVVDDGWRRRLARYAELAELEERETVALYLRPIEADDS